MEIKFTSEVSVCSLEQWPHYAYERMGEEFAQIANETPAVDVAEQRLLDTLSNVIFNAPGLCEVIDYAPLVRFLFPEPTYAVGCGSVHIWIIRKDEMAAARTEQRWSNRLAIIYPAGPRMWRSYYETVPE